MPDRLRGYAGFRNVMTHTPFTEHEPLHRHRPRRHRPEDDESNGRRGGDRETSGTRVGGKRDVSFAVGVWGRQTFGSPNVGGKRDEMGTVTASRDARTVMGPRDDGAAPAAERRDSGVGKTWVWQRVERGDAPPQAAPQTVVLRPRRRHKVKKKEKGGYGVESTLWDKHKGAHKGKGCG